MTGPTSRLLALLSLLQARRDWPGPALAGRLEVSERTVRRDVERLRELGYGIRTTKGPDGGYRLEAGSELPPLLFDDDQVVALAVVLQTAATTGAAVDEAAARALATMRQVMPSRLRHRLDALEVTPVRSGASADDVEPGVLLALSAAVRAREVLRLDHGAVDAPPDEALRPPRRVEPHHLVARRGRWYLVGWDLDREDWRTFRADRITPRTPTGPRFVPRPLPGGDVATFVEARFKGSDGADVWPCRGEVLLDLPAGAVAPFAGDGLVEPVGPDRCRLALGSWSWTALAAAIGRFDADVEVLGPDALVDAFDRLAVRYASVRPAGSPPGGAGPGLGPPLTRRGTSSRPSGSP